MLAQVLEKVEYMNRRLGERLPGVCRDGRYDDHLGSADNWTNGFWPGILWLAYQATGRRDYLEKAQVLEEKLDEIFTDPDRYSHDVGFIWLLSAVADYRVTRDEAAAQRGLRAAYILAGRFNPAGNFIRAWEGAQKEAQGMAIIDCMMNLPLLYWASGYTGDPRFSHIARRHTETTLQYFIRGDGSARHICVFDSQTGEFQKELGGQGYDVGSAWSRGCAWALYGFSLAAFYTGEERYLEAAEKIADFFLGHLPEDLVPMADFLAPREQNIHKDSSAAATAASGLVSLSGLMRGKGKEEKGRFYLEKAEGIARSLFDSYRDGPESEGILLHGCAAFHAPQDGTDIGVIFGDYFSLETLMKLEGWKGFF